MKWQGLSRFFQKEKKTLLPIETELIQARAFANRPELENIVIPGTVKRVGFRAFENCPNLKTVIFSEGVEQLDDEAFKGCASLRTLCIPASLRRFSGRAFAGSGLTEPVLSRDGRVLIYAPDGAGKNSDAVPQGVEEIGPYAFEKQSGTKTIYLPQSLKRIRKQAFCKCGPWTVRIPRGVEVEARAFDDPEHLCRLEWEEEWTPLEERMARCRARGEHFLTSRRISLPRDAYWLHADFIRLARRCAQGCVEAMEEMSAFFANHQEENTLFCRCAAHFWLVRAFRFGSASARAQLEKWAKENPADRMVSPMICEDLSGVADGEALNALGFLFFEAGREYALSGVDEQGVVAVSSYESEEEPDEDGFGREICYDWWYLDQFLNLPEGLGYIHSYSNLDKRNDEARFTALHDQAAAMAAGTQAYSSSSCRASSPSSVST